MNDPLPENITGEKSVSHVVEHRINWGHVALGVAGLYAIWKVSGALGDGDRADHAGEGVEIGWADENERHAGVMGGDVSSR